MPVSRGGAGSRSPDCAQLPGVLAALIGKGEGRVNLYEAWGKFVRITTDDGQVFEGKATDYTSALDNDPDPASICIGDTELYENEIVSIEMLPT